MKLKKTMAGLLASAALLTASLFTTVPAWAVNLHFVMGSTGADLNEFQTLFKQFEQKTGDTVTVVPMPSSTTDQFSQYRLWLAAGNQDIDVYMTDVIWAPQLADHFVDLTDAAKKDGLTDQYIPQILQSQTVDGKVVALPVFTDAPALFYRKDLLTKYDQPVPTTWTQMASEAKLIMDKERAAGNKNMWGFVFQGNAYEGLTCDALEWIKSYGGGQIVDPNGDITVDNPKAAAALEEAKSWVGTISPPGVLGYQEEESRGVWQLGNSVFMRNWPYAYALGNGADSPIKDKFGVTTLPHGPGGEPAATLGGWNVAVSQYSPNKAEAIKLALYIASKPFQTDLAIKLSHLPTIASVYDDPEVTKAQPIVGMLKDVVLHAVPRPSAPTKGKYNEVSSNFWTAVHNTLAGQGSAQDNLDALYAKLTQLKGSGW